MGDPIAAYRERMYAVGKGSALWHPSPRKFDQHDEPQPHVRVGDVGYIDRGQWTLLFNVHTELPGALIRNPSRQPLEKPGTRIHVSTRELPPGLGHWSVAGDSSSGVGTRLSRCVLVSSDAQSISFMPEISIWKPQSWCGCKGSNF